MLRDERLSIKCIFSYPSDSETWIHGKTTQVTVCKIVNYI